MRMKNSMQNCTVFVVCLFFLSVVEGQATTILADLYVESFGNIEEANMVGIMVFLR